MAIIKCKMCGGTLDIQEGQSVAVCEYCGTKQTLPKLDDERKANLYDRANHFRRNNDYDKAMSIYEQILSEDSADAESYWSLVLCKYGIEYVEDPVSRKRIPTVNRAQFTSVLTDENYQMALKHADVSQRMLYEEEAATIDEIQKGILAISSKEEPFDVFICYKESDASGARTVDSVLAQDIYYQLTEQGFKVFFARITLESKVGQQYEPYIFAALNSAKVMVIVGTKPEYYNAVWVKNEWSRYLKIVQNDKSRLVIPAYKDMDPYDLPEALSYYQAQDMSKIGFVQDLIRGIKKVLDGASEKTERKSEGYSGEGNSNMIALLKRGNLALEDAEWSQANDFFERVLDLDAECAEAYMGKLLAESHISSCSEYCKVQLERTKEIQPRQQKMIMHPEIKARLEAEVDNNNLDRHVLGLTHKEIFFTTEAEEREFQYDQIRTNKIMTKVLRFVDENSAFRKELDVLWQELERRLSEARLHDEAEIEKADSEMQKVIKTIEANIEKEKEERERKYQQVYEMYTSGESKYTKAQIYRMFEALGDYKDSKKICSEIMKNYVTIKKDLEKRDEELSDALYSMKKSMFDKKRRAILEQSLIDVREEKVRFIEEYGTLNIVR